jgi:hypothetical protein
LNVEGTFNDILHVCKQGVGFARNRIDLQHNFLDRKIVQTRFQATKNKNSNKKLTEKVSLLGAVKKSLKT